MQNMAGVIRKLIQKNAWVYFIARELATVEKPKPTTDVTRLRKAANNNNKGLWITKTMVDDLFVEFQRCGFGKFHLGQGRGDASRMEWKPGLNPWDSCRDALDGIPKPLKAEVNESLDFPSSYSPTKSSLADAKTALVEAGVPSGGPTLVFMLKTGRQITLTIDEVQELKATLSKL